MVKLSNTNWQKHKWRHPMTSSASSWLVVYLPCWEFIGKKVQWQLAWITDSRTISNMKSPPGQLQPEFLLPSIAPVQSFPGQFPPLKFPTGKFPLVKLSINNFLSEQLLKAVSSWVVLSLNFTLREASITNGDPCRGGIVSPLLPPWPFFTFFFNLV